MNFRNFQAPDPTISPIEFHECQNSWKYSEDSFSSELDTSCTNFTDSEQSENGFCSIFEEAEVRIALPELYVYFPPGLVAGPSCEIGLHTDSTFPSE